MPAAVEYVPPTSQERDGFSASVIRERGRRQRAYRRAVDYYEGKHDQQLEVEFVDDPDYNTYINLVKMTADRTASFLFPTIPEIELDKSSVTPTDNERWVSAFMKEAFTHPKMIKWVLRGFLSGHTFIRVKPPDIEGGMPRVLLLDPNAITIYWKADDASHVLWYENRYRVGEQIFIEDYIRNKTNGNWKIHKYRLEPSVKNKPIVDTHQTPSGSKDTVWTGALYPAGASWVKIKSGRHDSIIPPIIDVPHLPHPDDHYGMTEFNQKELQDTINRLWSEINRIVHENSDPVDVMFGVDADELQEGKNVLATPTPKNVAGVERLTLDGDLTAAVSTVDKLVETFLAIQRVVLLKGEAKDLQRVTNAAVRTLFLDAIAKNKQLQGAYGAGLKQIIQVALQMAGKTMVIPNVEVKWADPLPTDQTELANVAVLAINAGFMSRQTAATKQGLDWSVEIDAMEKEADNELFQDPEPQGVGTNPQAGVQTPNAG